ncbi:ABC transporter ATP-binding protein [Billgrantia aerodenitrificans]|uniref:ABC-type dipeptide transporter n=1 Tax=Billgrantia aerodenitrificans TaxID=2733483 RepID=A0ABS9AUH5_9GAMM|nr:ABC transporter ATP-binding protein [Halomonas aerodenitrificans]MCE8025444.1 ABC transporter ATP-binding protein [Halomonas aerodenitrificans]
MKSDVMTRTAVQAPMAAPAELLVEIRDLHVHFGTPRRQVQAVNGVDLTLARGEVLTILGESGSGKSVTLRSLMRLLPERKTRLTGSVRVDGQDVLAMSRRELSRFRGRTAAMIFQEPMLAFDPVFSVGDQIAETVCRHEGVSRREGLARALELFDRVRIPSAKRRLANYPHELSGGMSQRAMIALALSCRPKLLLADEPTTALDATVQIQILLLLRELQRELGMSVIFVTHDMGVANEISDRIAVMYAGRLVETGAVDTVIAQPRHPYTLGLMHSRASGELRGQRLSAIPGAPPDMSAPPPGCAFAPRCPHADATCTQALPGMSELGSGHRAACWRLGETAS